MTDHSENSGDARNEEEKRLDAIQAEEEADLPQEDRDALDAWNWEWDVAYQTALELLNARDYAGAVELGQQVVRLAETDLEHDTNLPISLDLLACACLGAKQLPEAEATLQQLVQRGGDILGKEHPVVGKWHEMLGTTCYRAGKLPRAERALRESLRIYEASLHPDVLLNDPLMSTPDGRMAAIMTVTAGEGLPASPDGHPAMIAPLLTLSRILWSQKKVEEAAALCSRALEVCDKCIPDDMVTSTEATILVGQLYQDLNRPHSAARIYKGQIDILSASPYDDPQYVYCRGALFVSMSRLYGRYAALTTPMRSQLAAAAAYRWLRRGMARAVRDVGPDHDAVAGIADHLAALLDALKQKPAEAAHWRLEAARIRALENAE